MNEIDSKSLLKHIVDTFYRTDIEGRLVLVSPSVKKLLGYNVEELLGTQLADLYVEKYQRQQFLQQLKESDGQLSNFQALFRHKNGGEVWLATSSSYYYDKDGKITGVEGIARDITIEHQTLESLKNYQENLEKLVEKRTVDLQKEMSTSQQKAKALQKSNKKLELLMLAVGQAYEIVMITDSEGITQYVNAAFEKITGYSSEEAIGQHPSFLSSGKQDKAFFKKMWTTLQQGDIWSGHFINRKKDGTLFEEEATISPVKNNEGLITNFIAVKCDVTKEVSLEKQLRLAQKMEVVGLMASGVAHDLNNILAGVVSYPDLILQQLPEESDLRRPLEAIQESGQRAATIVADLLTVSRDAASNREIADIHTLVQEYMQSLEYKNLEVLHPNVTCLQQLKAANSTISCSPVHVKKCLMNLMINASESIAGDGTIVVSSSNQYIDETTGSKQNIETGKYIVLSIQDTGSGISKNDLEHIFEPFYTKKHMGRSGTGLGLTVVWNTMNDHNGKVLVESTSTGTCFQLYFPLSNEKKTEPPKKKTTKTLSGNKEHILVVDDEPQLRDIISQILKILGYMVDTVDSGELALEFIKETPVDLIIIDMLMEPGMNGRQTYEEILKRFPDQKAIIASGFSESNDIKAALRLGALGFVQKPFSMEQLGKTVKKALNS